MPTKCAMDFKRQMNSTWTFKDVLSEDADRQKSAIVHSLQAGADLWKSGCHCDDCRDAYLKIVASLVGGFAD